MRINLVQKFDGVFDRKTFDHIIALAAKARWVLALHMDPPSLLKIADEIRKMPVTTVIDNYAMIEAREGLDQPAVKILIDLAQEEHVWLKTASAYRMLFKGAIYEQMLPVACAVSAASPDRVIWGTDWPHSGVYALNKTPNDGDLVDWLAEIVPDETLRRKMLVDNPKRLFDPS
jgi:predicted TIM-barrel fold metal-dependent hydrolase